jgi:hypothetical protein
MQAFKWSEPFEPFMSHFSRIPSTSHLSHL